MLPWSAFGLRLMVPFQFVSKWYSEWQENWWWCERGYVSSGCKVIFFEALGKERRKTEAGGEIQREWGRPQHRRGNGLDEEVAVIHMLGWFPWEQGDPVLKFLFEQIQMLTLSFGEGGGRGWKSRKYFLLPCASLFSEYLPQEHIALYFLTLWKENSIDFILPLNLSY